MMIPRTRLPFDNGLRDFEDTRMTVLERTDRILPAPAYPGMGLGCAVDYCAVRTPVKSLLHMASLLLPEGLSLKILDAWRPFSLQAELYDYYADLLEKRFSLSALPEEERLKIVHSFVSPPVPDRDSPPVHTTGGAVDLTLVRADGTELYMGTGFDDFSPAAATAYFEGKVLSAKNREARDNRRLLYRVMTDVGFTNLPSEWWHFDLGDKFWSCYTGRPALFRGLFEVMDWQ